MSHFNHSTSLLSFLAQVNAICEGVYFEKRAGDELARMRSIMADTVCANIAAVQRENDLVARRMDLLRYKNFSTRYNCW